MKKFEIKFEGFFLFIYLKYNNTIGILVVIDIVEKWNSQNII